MIREREAKISDLEEKIYEAKTQKRNELVETYKSALSSVDKDSGPMYESLATLLSMAIQKDGNYIVQRKINSIELILIICRHCS